MQTKEGLKIIQLTCSGFANQMYCRYGQPVFLVGSSLNNDNPRDVDIRVTLPDDVFEARYGSVKEWREDTWRNEWREARQKWANDTAKLSSFASVCVKMNIDFQVIPESLEKDLFKDKVKVRIDTIKDDWSDSDGVQV